MLTAWYLKFEIRYDVKTYNSEILRQDMALGDVINLVTGSPTWLWNFEGLGGGFF